MRGGVVVIGEGTPSRRIPDKGGVRWDLVGTRRIGDSDLSFIWDGCIFEGVADNIESFIGDMDNEKEGGRQMEAVKRGAPGDVGVIDATVVCIVVVIVRSEFASELSSLLLKTRSFTVAH